MSVRRAGGYIIIWSLVIKTPQRRVSLVTSHTACDIIHPAGSPKERRNAGRESRRGERGGGGGKGDGHGVSRGTGRRFGMEERWSRREISRWRRLVTNADFLRKTSRRMSTDAKIERIMNNSRRRFSYTVSRRAVAPDSSNGIFVKTRKIETGFHFSYSFALTDSPSSSAYDRSIFNWFHAQLILSNVDVTISVRLQAGLTISFSYFTFVM